MLTKAPLEVENRFELGEESKELLISQADAPAFGRHFIRMAGITEAIDHYLCARRQPLHHTLVLTVAGSGELLTGGETHILERSGVAILRRGQSFQYHKQGGSWKFLWFILEDCQRWKSLLNLPSSLENMTCSDRISSMLFLLSADIPQDSKSILSRDLLQLLIEALQLPTGEMATQGRLQNVYAEVNAQLQYPWNIKRLAQQMHCSEPTLHRICRKVFGQSPMQKVMDLRMQRVRFLLENTDWRLNEIAAQVGYKDGLNLSRTFKRKTGFSPAKVRTFTVGAQPDE